MKVKSNYGRSLVVGLLAMIMLLIGFCVMPVNRTETAKADSSSYFKASINGTVLTVSCVQGQFWQLGWAKGHFEDVWQSGGLLETYDFNFQSVEKTATFDLQQLIDSKQLEYNVEYTFNFITPAIFNSNTIYFTPRKSLPLPIPPEKEGYTFVEWCLDEALTIVYDGREITEDLKLYAKFKINTYTVTFNSNGGTTVASQTLDYNTIATLTSPTRVGYDFIGWFIGETQYIDGAIKADTTLVAKWKIQTFKVTFMVGDEVYKELTVDYGTTLVKALQVANMAYYSAVNASGEKLDSSEKIVGDITLSVVEMTNEEKVATFLAKNIWILWTAGISIVVLIMLVSVLVSKTKK